MRSIVCSSVAALVLALVCRPAAAQQEKLPPPVSPPAPTVPTPPPAPTPPPPADAVAATVNGQNIMEVAVYRALRSVPADKRKDARVEIVNFLVENMLVEQFLKQQGVAVDAKEVDARVDEMRTQLKRQNLEFDKVLKEMSLTEPELRGHIEAELRWEKWIGTQAKDESLRELYAKNPEMFDGSMVHARHILLTPPSGDAKANEEAKAQLAAYRKQVEDEVAKGMAKLPPTADALAKEKERTRLMDESFAAIARQKSSCPSKEQGGDVGWFPRAGSMVEPFAKAAFALQPYQMSDVVTTQFGYHLILAVERRAGKPTKFEDVKEEVKDVFGGQKREALLPQLRQTGKITINPAH